MDFKSKFTLFASLFTVAITLVNLDVFGVQAFLASAAWGAMAIYAVSITKNKTINRFLKPSIFIYPIFEFILKLSILTNLVPYSWRTLNIVEHGIYSGFITIFVFIFIKTKLPRQPKLGLIFSILTVNLVGVINEIIEYILRTYQGLELLAYYPDSIIDLATNLVFAGAGAILIYLLLTKQNDTD